jgi:hypothetical protein
LPLLPALLLSLSGQSGAAAAADAVAIELRGSQILGPAQQDLGEADCWRG